MIEPPTLKNDIMHIGNQQQKSVSIIREIFLCIMLILSSTLDLLIFLRVVTLQIDERDTRYRSSMVASARW